VAPVARRRASRGGARRRRVVALELLVAGAICFVGYAFGARPLQELEARWVVWSLRLVGREDVSAALPGHILIFGDEGVALNAEVTASCSSVLSIVGLTALAFTVFRGRRQHALVGLLAAVAALLALNWVRLTASTLAGTVWGRPAMILFHDWVGSLWNFVATFLGFLVLVAVTLPAPERAEQDADGRHTARRPDSWARPGLGYTAPDPGTGPPSGRRGLTSLVHRYLLPRRLSAHLGRRREAARIDYRIGHLRRAERIARVRELAADGLGAHTASLLAVATYERDAGVLDVLAEEVAARQWEPVTTSRVMSLRLWARAWTMARSAGPPHGAVAQLRSAGDEHTRPIAGPRRPPVPVAASWPARRLPMTAKPTGALRSRRTGPRPASFALPPPVPSGPTDPTAEDLR
jgi:carbamoyl-phosphate synthase large subunit